VALYAKCDSSDPRTREGEPTQSSTSSLQPDACWEPWRKGNSSVRFPAVTIVR
jgi:hypothetical protein